MTVDMGSERPQLYIIMTVDMRYESTSLGLGLRSESCVWLGTSRNLDKRERESRGGHRKYTIHKQSCGTCEGGGGGCLPT